MIRLSRPEATVCASLEVLRRRLLDAGDETARATVMAELWTVIAAVDDEAAARRITRAALPEPVRRLFARHWARHVRRLEHRRCRLVALGDPLDLDGTSVLAVEEYSGIDSEATLVSDRTYGRVVMVGCGPYPETLMALADSGVAVGEAHGLDRSRAAAELAERALRPNAARWPSLRMGIGHASGSAYEYDGADLVVLANGLTGKEQVLERIALTASPEVRVLVRAPVLLARTLYEDVEIHGGWTIAGVARPTRLSQTLLLVRGAENP